MRRAALPALKDALGVYGAFMRVSFLKMLAYRARYFTGIVTYLLFVTVHYFIWQAVYHGDSSRVINGFTLPQMVTYIAVAWIARSLYFSDIDYDIDDLVRTGQISNSLIRPVNFQLMMLAQAFGETLFRAVFFTLPIGIVILCVYPVQPPAGALSLAAFFAASCGSFLVLVEINFLVGILAFPLKSIQGVIRAKYYIVQLFSGLLLPLSFFPSWASGFLDVLPFKAITYLPMQFYLGRLSGSEVLWTVFTEAAWIIALFLLGRYFWLKALARLTLQGG